MLLARRRLLAGLAGSRLFAGLAGSALLPLAWPAPAAMPDRKLVVVILRGGMDGLHAVPPIDDPDYARARGALALPKAGAEGGVLGLGNGFSLHPAMTGLADLYARREALLVHAVATPYRERSHFDGQDVLESGAAAPHRLADGWVNRLLVALKAPSGAGMAVGQGLPLSLRGQAPATSWAPSPLPGLAPAAIERMRALYAGDPLFAAAFEEGVQSESMVAEALAEDALENPATMEGGAGRAGRGAFDFAGLAGKTGRILAAPDGPAIAVMEAQGFDTHLGQGLAQGRLAQALGRLSDGIAELARAMGPAWRRTVVLAASEFGRTVAANGTGGTDHGTAGAVILAGGALAGGRVLADWPGLAPARLHQGRDLMPTQDFRAVCKGILRDHLDVSPAVLDGAVFPDSGAVRPLAGLIRA